MRISIFFLILIFSQTLEGQFTNITEEAGISHIYSLFEYVGAGAVFIDLNNDGWEDLYLPGGTSKDRLYMSDSKGGFEDISFKLPYNNNVSKVSAAIAGDIDNDGCTDLFLTTLSQIHPNMLLKGDCEGNLSNITFESNIIEQGRSIGASFIDYNLDGYLDIYVANYVDTTRFILDSISGDVIGYDHICSPNYFYENNGDNTFTELANELEIQGEGCTLAVLSFYTEDKDVAIYVANDFGEWVKPNELFVKSKKMDTFIDRAPMLGLDVGIYGMGISMGDVGNDLDNDFYVTNLGQNAFLENDNGFYINKSEQYGIGNTYVEGDLLATSWGTFFFDVENDTDLDLFVANGYIPSASIIPTSEYDPSKLFTWSDGSFNDESEAFNLDLETSNRGCISSDYDHDGDLDILINSVVRNPNIKPGVKAELFRNDTPAENAYLKVLLEGVTNSRDGFGTNVFAYLNNGKALMRTLYSGGTHASQNSKLIHFGLGDASLIDSIRVDWPNGVEDIIFDIPVNNNIFFQEGNSNFEILGCMDPTSGNYNPLATINYACKEGTTYVEDVNTDWITIQTNDSNVYVISEINLQLKYTIYNILGERLSTRQNLMTTDKITSIDVSFLTPGAYSILIEDNIQRKAFPFVIL